MVDAAKIHQTYKAVSLTVIHSANCIKMALPPVIIHARDTAYALDLPTDIIIVINFIYLLINGKNGHEDQ